MFFFFKIDYRYRYIALDTDRNPDLDPDSNWAKILDLDPDPNSMYLIGSTTSVIRSRIRSDPNLLAGSGAGQTVRIRPQKVIKHK